MWSFRKNLEVKVLKLFRSDQTSSFCLSQLWTTRMWLRRAQRRRRRTSCRCPRKTPWSTARAAPPASPTRRPRHVPRATACWPRRRRMMRCGTAAWSTSGLTMTCWVPPSTVLVSVSDQMAQRLTLSWLNCWFLPFLCFHGRISFMTCGPTRFLTRQIIFASLKCLGNQICNLLSRFVPK